VVTDIVSLCAKRIRKITGHSNMRKNRNDNSVEVFELAIDIVRFIDNYQPGIVTCESSMRQATVTQ